MTSPTISNSFEIDFYCQNLRKNDIITIGSLPWFKEHQRLEKLRLQCLFEAINCVEERVKNVMVTYEKVPLLVYEAVCIKMWRENVFKKILKLPHDNFNHSFIGYMILYHECTAVNFLQVICHHREVVQSLTDVALDLVDYCAAEIINLFSMKKDEYQVTTDVEDGLIELRKKEQEMRFNCALACVTIVASLSEYIEDLSISCIDRIYNTHDFPILMTYFLEIQPWKRQTENGIEVINDGKWRVWDTEELCKSEAQCWFVLRGLLLHEAAKQYYDMTDFRKQKLMEVQKHLHEFTIDQISPLIELKQFLSQLSVWNPPHSAKKPLLMETIPEIHNSLAVRQSHWKKLAEKNINLIRDGNEGEAIEIAKICSETYDGDILADVDGESFGGRRCQRCGKAAEKKCSQCQKVSYCSRDCQIKCWKLHKPQCMQKN